MTTATDAENQFLENMPGEIKEVLRWYADGQSRGRASESMAEFAGRFLGGMYEDGAVLPTNLSASAPEVLRSDPPATSDQSSECWSVAQSRFRTSARSPLPSQ